MKKCTKCKKIKKETQFWKNKARKDGLNNWCKSCAKIYEQANSNQIAKNKKKYREQNREKIKEQKQKWNEKNKVKIAKQHRKHYEDHLEEYLARAKKRRKQKRSQISAYDRKYRKKRYHTDIKFKILLNLKSRTRSALKGKNKSKPILKLLGCSIEFLKKHLEKEFKPGMTWDNHSRTGWHIDHIKPCDKFDLTKESEQHKCFHYTNLQPLWSEENLKKGSKY